MDGIDQAKQSIQYQFEVAFEEMVWKLKEKVEMMVITLIIKDANQIDQDHWMDGYDLMEITLKLTLDLKNEVMVMLQRVKNEMIEII